MKTNDALDVTNQGTQEATAKLPFDPSLIVKFANGLDKQNAIITTFLLPGLKPNNNG